MLIFTNQVGGFMLAAGQFQGSVASITDGLKQSPEIRRGETSLKTLVTTMIVLTFLALSVSFSPRAAVAQQKTRQVKIYLRKGTDSGDPKNPHNFYPVTRRVPSRAPLRPTLEALLAGPTAAEEAEGIMSSTFGLKLVSVKIRNGTAYTRFTQPASAPFPGDLAPFIFSEAVEKTAKQFPTVKRVIVCLDGILDFGDESDRPSKPCPKEPK